MGAQRNARSGVRNCNKQTLVRGDCQWQPSTQLRHRSVCLVIEEADVRRHQAAAATAFTINITNSRPPEPERGITITAIHSLPEPEEEPP